jgi:RNA polymerase sigma factor (sigma-70 family)
VYGGRPTEEPATKGFTGPIMSYEILVQRISPTIKRIASKLDGRFSFIDDADLYQEALVHLWIHYGEGKLADKTDSYILQGCYFHLKNVIRKIHDNDTIISLSTVNVEDGTALAEILSPKDVSSFEHIEGRMHVEAIEASGMTEREKDVLESCMEGMTTREIGKRMGISHVAVVKIRNKIKMKYQKAVGE